MMCHRRLYHPSRVPLFAALVGSMWLAGCASTSSVPSSTPTPEAASAYTRLGVAYLERDNLPRALNALDRALEIAPDNAEALQAIALVYQQQGESDLADQHFQRAIEATPDFTRARNNYAAFLYQEGQVEAACNQLESASQDAQYDNRAQLFANLGQCYMALGESDLARARFERAQRINPRNPRGYLMLAELEYSQGNYTEAWSPLQEYLQLAGPNQEALTLAIDIAEARGDHAAVADYQRQLSAN
ncbi:MAG: type IV pilus biogenesis/stability protein PilW [Halomonas sp.]|nr:type IV pilus biogenesis/stability protein PilW [Halomonas sp.]